MPRGKTTQKQKYNVIDPVSNKGTRGSSAHRRLRSTCASAQPKQSFRLHLLGSQGYKFSSDEKLRLLSDYADAQTKLNIRCAHLPTCMLYPLNA